MQPSPFTEQPCRETLWEATAVPGPELHSVSGEHRTEVLVVGAGIAGMSTALHLAAEGCDVAVVEAREPGSGATGESGGLVAPDYIRHSPSGIEDQFGEEWGARLNRFVGSGARRCFELIEKYQIPCGANRGGFWVPAHSSATWSRLQQQAGEWRKIGFDVECVPQEETRARLGSSHYCGAIRYTDGGSLNPLALVRGVTKAAIAHGAAVFCGSPVTELVHQSGMWRARTPQGQVVAKRVVLAANGGNSNLHPLMRRTVLSLPVIEYATEPLSDRQRAAVLVDGGAFTDKQPYVFTARYDEQSRLIAAIPDFFAIRGRKALMAEAVRRLNNHFPVLESVAIDYMWRGTAYLNTSLLPKVYRLEDSAIAVQACNGRGIAINLALGKEVAAAVLAGTANLESMQIETPPQIRAHPVMKAAPSVLMAMAYLRSRFAPGRRRPRA